MNKIIKLCSCEWTKIVKRTSTKVMLIILVVSLVISAGLAWITKKMSNSAYDYIENMDYKLSMTEEIERNNYDIKSNGDMYDTYTKNSTIARNQILQFAIDNDINIYTSYWKSEVINEEMQSLKFESLNAEIINDNETKVQAENTYNQYSELIKNNDFSGYIETKKQTLREDLESKKINQDEYDDESYILGLREKYSIGKEYNKDENWKSSIIEEMKMQKLSLRTGIDQFTAKALSEKDYKKISDSIKINEYRLEHNSRPYAAADGTMGSTRKVYDYMAPSLAIMVIAVMMIIIAGGSISSEISKGTIKFWSFTPYKRWKILLSKLLTSTIILILVTIFMTIISIIIGRIFFGASQDYIYVLNGEVHALNSVVFNILYNLVAVIDVFVFLVFAMMLSTVIRNTAAAVGISIAAYLGGATIMQIVNIFVKSDWTKFIPFNNFGLADKIFTGDLAYSMNAITSSVYGTASVKFSIVYLIVCVFIMVVTMFDSFRKRDIV